MTETAPQGQCGWCGRAFDLSAGRGRPRKFCSHTCRQKDYVARLRARDVGLTEEELIVTRAELEELRDKLFVLECAMQDVQRDVAEGEDLAQALEWILQAAAPLIGSPLGDRST